MLYFFQQKNWIQSRLVYKNWFNKLWYYILFWPRLNMRCRNWIWDLEIQHAGSFACWRLPLPFNHRIIIIIIIIINIKMIIIAIICCSSSSSSIVSRVEICNGLIIVLACVLKCLMLTCFREFPFIKFQNESLIIIRSLIQIVPKHQIVFRIPGFSQSFLSNYTMHIHFNLFLVLFLRVLVLRFSIFTVSIFPRIMVPVWSLNFLTCQFPFALVFLFFCVHRRYLQLWTWLMSQRFQHWVLRVHWILICKISVEQLEQYHLLVILWVSIIIYIICFTV